MMTSADLEVALQDPAISTVVVPPGAALALALHGPGGGPAQIGGLNLTRSVSIEGEAPASLDQPLPTLDLQGLQDAITICPGCTLTLSNLELVNHQSGPDYLGLDALRPSPGSFVVWRDVLSRRRAGLPLEWVLEYLLSLPRVPGPPSLQDSSPPPLNGNTSTNVAGRRRTLLGQGAAGAGARVGSFRHGQGLQRALSNLPQGAHRALQQQQQQQQPGQAAPLLGAPAAPAPPAQETEPQHVALLVDGQVGLTAVVGGPYGCSRACRRGRRAGAAGTW